MKSREREETQVTLRELQILVDRLNRISGMPGERFETDGGDFTTEQMGHYYLRYETGGLALARVVTRKGHYHNVFQGTFGNMNALERYLRAMINHWENKSCQD